MAPRLTHAPVFFTLAQMRFNPDLELDKIVPALQNDLRGAGFPDFEPTEVQAIDFQQKGQEFSFSQNRIKRYIFRNKEKTAAVMIDSSSLTYELTDYPIFEEFSGHFMNALSILNNHRPIEYCERTGMRMLDAIQPKGDDKVSDYVAPQALGLSDLFSDIGEHQQSFAESRFSDGSRNLIVRTLRAKNGVHAPPDLQPIRLNIKDRFTKYKGEVVMLDSDCFKEHDRIGFNEQQARDDLRSLKDGLSESFYSIVTDYARETWA